MRCYDVKVCNSDDPEFNVTKEMIKIFQLIPCTICLFAKNERYDIPLEELMLSFLGRKPTRKGNNEVWSIRLSTQFLERYLVKRWPNAFW